MQIHSPHDPTSRATRRSTTFSGEVWGEVAIDQSPDVVVNIVQFAPGARTHWHRHERGQVIYVTSGRGRVRARGGDERPITAGDAVWSPPGEEHYHGAADDSFMVHHAISLGRTEWLEEVSDDEYGN